MPGGTHSAPTRHRTTARPRCRVTPWCPHPAPPQPSFPYPTLSSHRTLHASPSLLHHPAFSASVFPLLSPLHNCEPLQGKFESHASLKLAQGWPLESTSNGERGRREREMGRRSETWGERELLWCVFLVHVLITMRKWPQAIKLSL